MSKRMKECEDWQTEAKPIFHCRCGSMPHILKICHYDDEPFIFFEMMIIPFRNIFQRIWIALKYIFVKEPIMPHDFIMKKKDINRMISILADAKEKIPDDNI